MVGQVELLDYLDSIGRIDIEALIPIGSKNAITREELSRRSGIGDRAVRELIHQARRNTPILNMQDGKGYYIPDLTDPEDVENLERYVRQEENRLKSTGWALKAARNALKSV